MGGAGNENAPDSSEAQTTPEKSGAREFGGPDEDRTHDLRIANATLSQLSYRPEREANCIRVDASGTGP